MAYEMVEEALNPFEKEVYRLFDLNIVVNSLGSLRTSVAYL